MSFEERLRAHRETLTGDFIAALEAEKFIEMMQCKYPGELDEWLTAHAIDFCRVALDRIMRHERAIATRRADARTFAEAETDEELGVFTTHLVVDPNQTRRAIGDMRAADHRFVAENYTASGNRALLLGAFHLAVAKRVGRRRTADVLTESEYLRLRDSITNASAAAA